MALVLNRLSYDSFGRTKFDVLSASVALPIVDSVGLNAFMTQEFTEISPHTSDKS